MLNNINNREHTHIWHTIHKHSRLTDEMRNCSKIQIMTFVASSVSRWSSQPSMSTSDPSPVQPRCIFCKLANKVQPGKEAQDYSIVPGLRKQQPWVFGVQTVTEHTNIHYQGFAKPCKKSINNFYLTSLSQNDQAVMFSHVTFLGQFHI